MIKVMVIDSNRAHSALIKSRLEDLGMVVATLTNPFVAAYAMEEIDPDVLLIDYRTCCVGGGDKVVVALQKYDLVDAEIALMSDDDSIMPVAAELGICFLDKATLFDEDVLENEVFRLAGEAWD